MWKPNDPSEGSWPLWTNNSCHRYLLRELWQKADTEPITFVSIDCEYDNTKICELGLTVQTKNEEPICRNIIISANRRSKADNKRFRFGTSEYVKTSADLFPILYKLCRSQRLRGHRVVFVGFDVGNDLKCLDVDVGWRPGQETAVLDAQHICKTFILKNRGVKLEDCLFEFNIKIDPQAPLHNGGNDSWYTMKLLFCKAQRDAENQQTMPKRTSSAHTPIDSVDSFVPQPSVKSTPSSHAVANSSTPKSTPQAPSSSKPRSPSKATAPRCQPEDAPAVQVLSRPLAEQVHCTDSHASPEQHHEATSSQDRPPCSASKLEQEYQSNSHQKADRHDDVNTATRELDESDQDSSLSTSTKKRKTSNHDSIEGAHSIKEPEHESKRVKALNRPEETVKTAGATEVGQNGHHSHSTTGQVVEVDGGTQGRVQGGRRGEAG